MLMKLTPEERKFVFYLRQGPTLVFAQLLQRFCLHQHPRQGDGLLLWAVEQVGCLGVEDDGLAVDVSGDSEAEHCDEDQ